MYHAVSFLLTILIVNQYAGCSANSRSAGPVANKCPINSSGDQCVILTRILGDRAGSQAANDRWKEGVVDNVVRNVAGQAISGTIFDLCRQVQMTADCKKMFDQLRCGSSGGRRNAIYPWFDQVLASKMSSACGSGG